MNKYSFTLLLFLITTVFADTLTLDTLLSYSQNSPDIISVKNGREQNGNSSEKLKYTNRAKVGVGIAVGHSNDVFTEDEYGYHNGNVHLVVPITGSRTENRYRQWLLAQEAHISKVMEERTNDVIDVELRKAYFLYWNSGRKIALLQNYFAGVKQFVSEAQERYSEGVLLKEEGLRLRLLISFLERDFIRIKSDHAEALWTINYHSGLDLDTIYTPLSITHNMVEKNLYSDLDSIPELEGSVFLHYFSTFVGAAARYDWKWDTGEGNDIKLYAGVDMPVNIAALVRLRKEKIDVQKSLTEINVKSLRDKEVQAELETSGDSESYKEKQKVQIAILQTIESRFENLIIELKYGRSKGVEDLFELQNEYVLAVVRLWNIEELLLNVSDKFNLFLPDITLCDPSSILALRNLSDKELKTHFNNRNNSENRF